MEPVDVDGFAKPKEAVSIEPLRLGVYLGVMVHAVGVKQDGRAGRDVQSVFEGVWLERVALAGDCEAGGLVLAGVLILGNHVQSLGALLTEAYGIHASTLLDETVEFSHHGYMLQCPPAARGLDCGQYFFDLGLDVLVVFWVGYPVK